MPRVTVAVLTFRRPAGLARVLPHLLDQAAALESTAHVSSVEVLVVDNDPAASARAFVESARPADGHRGAHYLHEPSPGIAPARNAALAASDGSEALVFIDDDEVPLPGWLAELVACWQRSAPAAVSGPVEPAFDAPADAWIRASGRFERRVRPTGSVVRGAATNNLLLDLAAVRDLDLRFDESFGLTGGEDTAFTHELVRRGARIVWCDEAVVREHIPAERSTRDWVLRREFRSGNSWSGMRLARTPGVSRRLVVRLDLGARGTGRVVGALARLGWGIARRDVTHRARGACLAATNAGVVAGAFGHRYGEYRRT